MKIKKFDLNLLLNVFLVWSVCFCDWGFFLSNALHLGHNETLCSISQFRIIVLQDLQNFQAAWHFCLKYQFLLVICYIPIPTLCMKRQYHGFSLFEMVVKMIYPIHAILIFWGVPVHEHCFFFHCFSKNPSFLSSVCWFPYWLCLWIFKR